MIRVLHAPPEWSPQIGRRTTQISIKPTTAEPMPTTRKTLSGIACALFIARRIQFGLAANIKPSNTNTRARPMRKSANARDLIGRQPPGVILNLGYIGRGNRFTSPLSTCDLLVPSGLRGRWRRPRRRRRHGRCPGRLAGRRAKILEEIGFRTQQITGIAAPQTVLIGGHRAIEGEKVGILAVGIREQAVALGVALAASLLGLRIGLGDDDRDFAVGVGTDFLRLLAALGRSE